MSARSFRRNAARREARRLRRSVLAATAAVGATGAFAVGAQADTFTVTTTGDGPTAACTGASPAFSCANLRDAVEAVNADVGADTITFQSGLSGTITLTQGELPLSTPTPYGDPTSTIAGPGAGQISISGDVDGTPSRSAGDSQVLGIAQGSDWDISGVTVSGGYSLSYPGAGIHADAGVTLALSDVVLSGNYGGPSVTGAGLYQNSNGSLAITDSRITQNVLGANGRGGGLAVRSPTTISGSTISGNSAENGAGIYAYGALTISDSTVDDNDSGSQGGGIRSSGALTIERSSVSGNTAGFNGGGIFSPATGAVNITDSTLSGNSAASGGGLSLGATGKYADSSATINRTTISGNHATNQGGGVYVLGTRNGSSVLLSHSTLSGNDSAAQGGGLAVSGAVSGSVRVSDSTISGNSASAGGGVSVGNDGAYSSTLYGNGSIDLDNSTVAANSATTNGGGVYIASYHDGDGGYGSAVVGATSTIVGDNVAANAPQDVDRSDRSTSGGLRLFSSLVEQAYADSISQSASSPSIVGEDPQLGPLADNGGPTLTQMPSNSSPVIDQGDSPARLETDQRGQPRRVTVTPASGSDGTDIGAVELQSLPAPPPPPDTTPPNTTVSRRPPKVIRTTKGRVKVTTRFTTLESGSTFRCKVGKGNFRACTSPLRINAASVPKRGKKYVVLIRATDAAGNVETKPARVAFRVIKKVKKKRG